MANISLKKLWFLSSNFLLDALIVPKAKTAPDTIRDSEISTASIGLSIVSQQKHPACTDSLANLNLTRNTKFRSSQSKQLQVCFLPETDLQNAIQLPRVFFAVTNAI